MRGRRFRNAIGDLGDLQYRRNARADPRQLSRAVEKTQEI
jgi:hypothetical protein